MLPYLRRQQRQTRVDPGHIERRLDGPDADTKTALHELKQSPSIYEGVRDMTFSPELLLMISVGVIGLLHTIVPDHWVPITNGLVER